MIYIYIYHIWSILKYEFGFWRWCWITKRRHLTYLTYLWDMWPYLVCHLSLFHPLYKAGQCISPSVRQMSQMSSILKKGSHSLRRLHYYVCHGHCFLFQLPLTETSDMRGPNISKEYFNVCYLNWTWFYAIHCSTWLI